MICRGFGIRNWTNGIKKTLEITTNIKTKYLGEIKKDLLNKIRLVTSLVLQEIIKKREESQCNPSDA